LRPGGFGIGVVGGAEHGNKDLCLTDFPGRSVHHGCCLASIIDKQLLTGTVVLAHDHIQLAPPGAVVLAKPAVLITLGVGFPVFLPEQEQSDALFASQFLMHDRPIGHTAYVYR